MSGSKRDMFREMFFEEARELLQALEEGLAREGAVEGEPKRWDPVYRAAHSLKGAAAMVGYPVISDQAFGMEKVLGQLRSGGDSWSDDLAVSLAADRARLTALINLEEKQFRDAP